METLSAIDKIDLPFQVMVVTGRNEALRQQLATCDWRHATRVLGFVNHMPELMAAADLIVTKPGGLTASEALAVGRPLLLVNPIPGQEEANAGFLLERGAAAKVNRVEDLGFRVAELLDQRRLRRMTTAAHRLGKPDAAEVACRAIQARLAERPRIAELPRRRPAWLRPPSDGTPVS